MSNFKPEVVPVKTWNGKITHYEASLFGFSAAGKTKDEALEKLHGIMCRIKPPGGTMSPRVIHYKDWVAIVWYDVEMGWMYGVRHEDDPRDISGYNSERLSRDEITDQARLELATQSYTPNVTDTSKVEYPEFAFNYEETRKEFHRRAIHINRHQYAIQILKLNPDEAHCYAGKDPGRPDLWKDK